MNPETMGIDDRVEQAVFACVVQFGLDKVTVDHVARELGRSRSTMYRQFANWQQLAAFSHGRAVEMLDQYVPWMGDDRRLQFEDWWDPLQKFLASPYGRVFLALRPHAATVHGIQEVEFEEMNRMPRLNRWVGSPTLTRVVWLIALTAACPTLKKAQRRELRERVWQMVTQPNLGSDDDEPDLEEARALGALL